jgi:hypothetical protein
MRSRKTTRFSIGIAALLLGATLVAPATGSAAPVLKYKCTGTINYRGTSFAWNSGTLWGWRLDGGGTCKAGVLKTVTWALSGTSFPSCGGPVATGGGGYPYSDYMATMNVTDPATGNVEQLRQEWVMGGIVGPIRNIQINARYSVPSRYIPIGGITGLGAEVLGKATYGYGTSLIKSKVVFGVGHEEIPNTDQPDGQAC